MLRKSIVLSALVLVSWPALAQNQLVLGKLAELNANAPQPPPADLTAAVSATAKAYSEASNTCAPKAVTLSDVAPITGARGILQAVIAGKLRNAWTAYATHVGCPGTIPVRYMVLQGPDGSLRAAHVNEGRTLANPVIMRDTSALAALAAFQKGRSIDPACTGESMKMGPTRVTSRSSDLGPELYGVRYVGKWTEVWQFETCGTKFDVPIEFTPDGDGGAGTRIISEQVAAVR